MTNATAAVAAPEKVAIRPDLTNYVTVKSPTGKSSKICGDEVSYAFVGATLDMSYAFVAGVIEVTEESLRAKYGERNLGQQRMFLANLVRGGLGSKKEGRSATVKAKFDELLPAFRAKIEDATKAANAAAEALKAEKAAAIKAKADEKAAEAEKAKQAKADAAEAAKKEKQAAAEAAKAEKQAAADKAKAAKTETKAAAKPEKTA